MNNKLITRNLFLLLLASLSSIKGTKLQSDTFFTADFASAKEMKGKPLHSNDSLAVKEIDVYTSAKMGIIEFLSETKFQSKDKLRIEGNDICNLDIFYCSWDEYHLWVSSDPNHENKKDKLTMGIPLKKIQFIKNKTKNCLWEEVYAEAKISSHEVI